MSHSRKISSTLPASWKKIEVKILKKVGYSALKKHVHSTLRTPIEGIFGLTSKLHYDLPTHQPEIHVIYLLTQAFFLIRVERTGTKVSKAHKRKKLIATPSSPEKKVFNLVLQQKQQSLLRSKSKKGLPFVYEVYMPFMDSSRWCKLHF